MGFFQNRNLKIWGGILIGLGVIGTIFFFPVNFQSRYTCLYHRIFHPSKCIHGESTEGHSHRQNGGEHGTAWFFEEPVRAEFGGREEGRSRDGEVPGKPPMTICGASEQTTTLVRHYVNNFAFFWWGSIVLIGLGAYAWRLKRNQKH